jgi:hypothetical protein
MSASIQTAASTLLVSGVVGKASGLRQMTFHEATAGLLRSREDGRSPQL